MRSKCAKGGGKMQRGEAGDGCSRIAIPCSGIIVSSFRNCHSGTGMDRVVKVGMGQSRNWYFGSFGNAENSKNSCPTDGQCAVECLHWNCPFICLRYNHQQNKCYHPMHEIARKLQLTAALCNEVWPAVTNLTFVIIGK